MKHADPKVRALITDMLAQGLAFKHIDQSLVIVAHSLGIDARLIADECLRQLDEMPSLSIH